jgi:hypothetical protein
MLQLLPMLAEWGWLELTEGWRTWWMPGDEVQALAQAGERQPTA